MFSDKDHSILDVTAEPTKYLHCLPQSVHISLRRRESTALKPTIKKKVLYVLKPLF